LFGEKKNKKKKKSTLETSWVVGVGSDLAVDLDEALLADLDDFTSRKSVLQSVSQKNNEWKALTELVWTRRGTGSLVVWYEIPDTSHSI